MSLSTDVSTLTPDTQRFLKRLFDAMRAEGFVWTVRSTIRSCREQNELYSIGRGDGDTRLPVTNARGCVSWHVLGRAVDITLQHGDYARMGELAEQLGGKWGGRIIVGGYPDVGHVEYHPGPSGSSLVDALTIEDMCPDPGDCDAAVARSFAYGGGSDGPSPLAFLVGAVAGFVLTSYAWKELR